MSGIPDKNDPMVTGKDIVVFDIDGTLADIEHRLKYIKGEKQDWTKFYEEAKNDKLNVWCEQLMACFYMDNYKVYLVSGRPVMEFEATRKWLKKHDVAFDKLFLLRTDTRKQDTELKREWLQEYKDRILFVVDDRQRVVDMYREEGTVCLQCQSWEEKK